MTDERATIVAPGRDCSPAARVTWTAQEVTVRDGNGRTTVLRHGVDVDSLALRRTPPPDGSAPGATGSWTLDLMQGETSRARFHSPPWDFDREHGAPEASAVSGLPLVQRAPALENPPAPVDPRPHGPLLRATILSAIVVPLLFCVLFLVPSLRGQPWTWAALCALALPLLLWIRVPPVWRLLTAGRRGTVVFRSGGGGGGVTAIIKRHDVLLIQTGRRTYAVPLPGDACGPVALRPGQWEAGESAGMLLLRASSGHVLATLVRSEWCDERSEVDLAAAIGVSFDPAPVTASPQASIASAMDRTESPSRAILLVSIPGPPALATGLMTDQGFASTAAVVMGGLTLLLGLVGMIISLAVTVLRDRSSSPRRTKGADHD